MRGQTCVFFRRGEECGRTAKWTVLMPMTPMSPGGGWERPACGSHLNQAIVEAAERTVPGEAIEVKQVGGVVRSVPAGQEASEAQERRKVCPVHGIPDCSPLLNGCSRLTGQETEHG